MSLSVETIQLSGAITSSGLLDQESLRRLPEHTVSVVMRCDDCDIKPERHVFTGVRLFDFLDPILSNPTGDSRRLRLSIVVRAGDGYTASIAWGEIDPHFANKPALLAWERDGDSLPSGYEPLQLIVPGDVNSGRCVHAIASILVHDPLATEE